MKWLAKGTFAPTDDPRVFTLMSDLLWQVDGKRFVHVAAGYEMDGANVPRVLWSVFGNPMSGDVLPAAALHDALYESELVSREQADDWFHEAMLDNGVRWFKALTFYAGVRYAGEYWWDRHDENSITRARLKVKVVEKGMQ